MTISAIGNLRSFTLIELLFVIIILGILIAVSLPSFQKTFDQIQLNSFSRQLQTTMSYLAERAVVEGKVIYLHLDNDRGEYWAKISGNENRLKTYHIPKEIKIETQNTELVFYPDGSIDEATIKLTNRSGQYLSLSTKGVFGGIKVQPQE